MALAGAPAKAGKTAVQERRQVPHLLHLGPTSVVLQKLFPSRFGSGVLARRAFLTVGDHFAGPFSGRQAPNCWNFLCGWLSKLWSSSGSLNTRCRIILRNQKGTIILTTAHVDGSWMGRSAAAFAESLKKNVSLYFPFLAYYQISYYRRATQWLITSLACSRVAV